MFSSKGNIALFQENTNQVDSLIHPFTSMLSLPILYQQSHFNIPMAKLGLFVRNSLNSFNTLGRCNQPLTYLLIFKPFEHQMYLSMKTDNSHFHITHICFQRLYIFFLLPFFSFRLDIPNRSRDNKRYFSTGLFSSSAE